MDGRKPFLQTLTTLAEKDPKVILIIGDVGFSFIEGFKERFPNQFLNTGACEQTMMNIAAGMANAGWKPYVYTMRNFIAFRPYEQVRNNIAYSNRNVKLFGVSGSAAYKFLGYSHNVGTINSEQSMPYEEGQDDEDTVMLASLPNMHVYRSNMEEDVAQRMMEEYERQGPAYFVI